MHVDSNTDDGAEALADKEDIEFCMEFTEYCRFLSCNLNSSTCNCKLEASVLEERYDNPTIESVVIATETYWQRWIE